MSRRSDFKKILDHQQPEKLILDLGGCPLSTMEGDSMYKVMDCLGLKTPDKTRLRFGKTRRLDESLLQRLDIDTRSVGEIYVPKDSQYEVLSDNEYIDEWGIRRKFTGLYWEQT